MYFRRYIQICLILLPLFGFSQKPFTFNKGNLGTHIYPIKYKSENKSLWISLHNQVDITDPSGGYIFIKVSLRVKETKVTYYNIYYRYYYSNKTHVYFQVKFKI